MSKPLFFSYHTNQHYADLAAGLKTSLERLGLEHFVMKADDKGSWACNVLAKAAMIQTAMDRFKCPIIWIDADCRVLRRPVELLECSADLAAHFLVPTAACTAVLYLDDSPQIRRLLSQWDIEMRNHPADQEAFNAALRVCRKELVVHGLGPEYCWQPWFVPRREPPIMIEHLANSLKED
jgi:hypothetical protein